MAAELIPVDAPPAVHAQAFLDAVAAQPKAFNMSEWLKMVGRDALSGLEPVQEVGSPPACGTTMCAAGWIVHNAGYTLRGVLEDGWRPYFSRFEAIAPNGRADDVGLVAAGLLGLNPGESEELFYGDDLHALAVMRRIARGDEWVEGQSIHEFAGVPSCEYCLEAGAQ